MNAPLRWERATPVALLLFLHEAMSATGVARSQQRSFA
jgi:hypothetical protein